MVTFLGRIALLGSVLLTAVYGHVLERKDFKLEDHLGNLSPYHKAPVPIGIQEDLPGDCKVEQVMLVRENTTALNLIISFAYALM